jgi:hypothetical protein
MKAKAGTQPMWRVPVLVASLSLLLPDANLDDELRIAARDLLKSLE